VTELTRRHHLTAARALAQQALVEVREANK
jgi:hypothetical protein